MTSPDPHGAEAAPPPTRRPTGTIPAHWTVPAEVSASAVERPRRPGPGPDNRPSTGRGAVALVVLLGLLGVALVVTGVIDVPLDGLRAESVRPVPDEPTVVKRPGDVRGPVGASAAAATAAPGTDAPSPGAPAEPLAVEPILPAVDNPPLVVPAVGGASPGSAAPASESSDDIELAGDSEPEAPEPLLDELPVRRKVRGLIDRGEGLIRKGKYRSASRVLERAAKLDPNFPRVQRSLGIARARLGDFDGARKAYERYLELDPTAPDAADVRRILGQ